MWCVFHKPFIKIIRFLSHAYLMLVLHFFANLIRRFGQTVLWRNIKLRRPIPSAQEILVSFCQYEFCTHSECLQYSLGFNVQRSMRVFSGLNSFTVRGTTAKHRLSSPATMGFKIVEGGVEARRRPQLRCSSRLKELVSGGG